MPTENEFKFVLRLDTDQRINNVPGRYLSLEQAYLGDLSARIRCESIGDNKKFLFTYKKLCDRTFASTDSRLVEIETEISQLDYLDLWLASSNRLIKTRFIPDEFEGWCIDFFCRWGTGEYNDKYFVMAEVELPEGQRPNMKLLPQFIEDNLLYTVRQDDDRFTSSKLFDHKYATELYQWLFA